MIIDTSSTEQLRIYIVSVKQGWVNFDYVPFAARIESAREQQNTTGKKANISTIKGVNP